MPGVSKQYCLPLTLPKRGVASTPLLILVALAMLLLAPQNSQAAFVFINEFNGTWNTSDGNPISEYTPDNIGDTFSNNSDSNGAVWTVTELTPQPWSFGGINFTGANLTTGEIATTISNTLAGRIYEVSWATQEFGLPAPTKTLFASAGGSTQILGINQSSSFTFVGTGLDVELRIGVQNVGLNPDHDIFLDSVSVRVVPEPSCFALALLGCGILAHRRRRA